ncbi:haptoglobin-like [Cuculus canorus]|uniref:haptoglobin-like n=1 Tax=Cuculus canorus TaxID=55661 RepID=UPI0023AA6D7D|nr:haptoglobin-like [Cuculus canorus]
MGTESERQCQWVSKGGYREEPVCEPVCGKPKNPPEQMQRIVGGLLARKGNFPWQGRLVTRHNLIAGATLISDQWLLTTGRNVYLNHREGDSQRPTWGERRTQETPPWRRDPKDTYTEVGDHQRHPHWPEQRCRQRPT